MGEGWSRWGEKRLKKLVRYFTPGRGGERKLREVSEWRRGGKAAAERKSIKKNNTEIRKEGF